MGRKLVVAVITGVLTVGSPVLTPFGRADAQNVECFCAASFDAVDSDLRYVGRYFNSTSFPVPVSECSATCDGWRRDWFYWHACDNPVRINRGRNAWWGYDTGSLDTLVGPDTWWCPFPPP